MMGLAYALSLYVDSVRYDTGFVLSPGMLSAFATVYISWTGLTIALYKLLKKPVIEANTSRCIVIFFLGLIVWQPAIALLDNIAASLFLGQPLGTIGEQLSQVRFTNLFFHTVLYIIVFGSCALLIYYHYSQQMKLKALTMQHKHAEAELDAANRHMQALQSRLSPHFLFNCLNSISALARSIDNAPIVNATARLGDLLRFAVQASKYAHISLSEEIEFTHHYVELQRLRFGHKFSFHLDQQETAGATRVPPFVLQTLVENAFTHSVENAQSKIAINARIEPRDGQLSLSVHNDLVPDTSKSTGGNDTRPNSGPNTGPNRDQSSGLGSGQCSSLGSGLDNLKKRLEILYRQNFSMHTKQADTFYVVEILLPLNVDDEEN